jgi:hypothetical protein
VDKVGLRRCRPRFYFKSVNSNARLAGRLIAPHHPPLELRAPVPGPRRKISHFSKMEVVAVAGSPKRTAGRKRRKRCLCSSRRSSACVPDAGIR